MEIQHFSHPEHPLFLKDDKIALNPLIRCGICARSNILAPFYACDSCGYYLHKSCAELPHMLDHSFHPSHPLTLALRKAYYCDSCHRLFNDVLSFYCDQCDFDMDVECALMPPITLTEVDQKKTIQHFSHQHPMSLVEMDNEDENNCFGCESTMCSGDRVYGCTKCKYFLHESCAKFPKEIEYPFHLDHGLLDFHIRHFEFTCTLCNKRYQKVFTFKCRQCIFQICLKCSASKSGTIKYKYHEHLLCFTRESNPINQCNNYDSYCKRPVVSDSKELSHTSSCAFYCLECDFKVHLLCGPLPSVIKHECHVDPLILIDSIIEDNSGEYYCDVCEIERDPRIRVYYCQPCKYIAHVHCVASEIINILTGDLRDVELKSLGEDIWKLAQENDTDAVLIAKEEQGKSPLTLKDLINALTEGEQHELKTCYKWGYELSKVMGQSEKYGDLTAQSELGDEDINWILELSRFNNEDFKKILAELTRFYDNTILELKSSDLALKIVTVKDYKIPITLAPVLRTFLNKYGDVSSNNTYSTKEWKSIVYFILCQVLKRMCSTKVGDLTRELLYEWFYHLAFVHVWDFEIGFVRRHFERLIRAFLGFQAKRLEDEIPTLLNQKIADFKKGLEKCEKDLEKCEEYRGSSAKSEFMINCLNEASEMKWKDACEDLFTDHA